MLLIKRSAFLDVVKRHLHRHPEWWLVWAAKVFSKICMLTQAQHLDAVFRQCAAILNLLAGEDQALMILRQAFLDVVDGVALH